MCGIALILGSALGEDDRRRFDALTAGIAPRGESLETELGETSLLATSRLKIVDRDRAVQPWAASSGNHSLCYNGEVFNHTELRARLVSEGHPLRSESDTEVVVEAWLAWGTDALLAFRGEFAFCVVDHRDGSVFIARDPAGIKPLYWARSEGRLYVASEIKSLTGLGLPINEVPPGHCGTGSADADPVLHPYIDLARLGEGDPMIEGVEDAAAAVRSAVLTAVGRRVDTDLPVGVILSGGLDSSLVATLVSRLHPDCVAFTVGSPGSEDLEYATRLTADLGIRHEVVELSPRAIKAVQVREAVRVSEATEYGDAINAVVSMEVFRAVHAAGIKVDRPPRLRRRPPRLHPRPAQEPDEPLVGPARARAALQAADAPVVSELRLRPGRPDAPGLLGRAAARRQRLRGGTRLSGHTDRLHRR